MKIAALANSQLVLGILLILIMQPVEAQSTGLKVIVHSNESGSVCVKSFSQDLGCRTVEGPDESVFEFSPESVGFNEVIDVCLNGRCQEAMNSIGAEPVDVYFPNEETGSPDYTTTEDGNTDSPDNSGVIIFLFVLFVGLILYLMIKGRKHRRREHFPSYMKKEVLKKQSYKCAICKKSAGVWDFDHLDGNRSNNDVSNCHALCPNCHAKKTRGMIVIETRKFSFKKYLFIGIFIFFILAYLITQYT